MVKKGEKLDLSTAERAAFRRINRELRAKEIDPASRQSLVLDLVRADGRIERLTRAEAAAGDDGGAAARALTAATSERRRLHKQVYALPHKGMTATAAEREERERAERELGDAEWAELLFPGDREAWLDHVVALNRVPSNRRKND